MTTVLPTATSAAAAARRSASALSRSLRGCVARKRDALPAASTCADSSDVDTCIRLSSSSSHVSSDLSSSSPFVVPSSFTCNASLVNTRFFSSVGGSRDDDDGDEQYDDFHEQHDHDDDHHDSEGNNDNTDDTYYLSLPQSDHDRIDLAADPVLAKLDPVQTAKRILSDIPVGNLNPSDVLHGLTPLLKDCCLLQTEEGMKTAQSLLERLVKEKKNINAIHLQTLKDQAAEQGILANASEVAPPLVVPALPFHILAHGWSRMSGRGFHRHGPEKVSDIIDWMAREDQYDIQIRDDFEALVLADGNDEEEEEKDSGSGRRRRNTHNKSSCQPTTATYNTLLTAYTYASRQDRLAGKKAERIVRTMTRRNEEEGWHCKPNTRSFGLAISAHAKSDRYKSAIFAQYVLNDMKVMHEAERERYEAETGRPYNVEDPDRNAWRIVTPDAIAFTTVISAFASADGKGYAQRAEDVLFEMIDNSAKYGIRVDSPAFDACIRGWSAAAKRMGNPKARFEAAERAEGILKLMEEMAAEVPSTGDSANGIDEDVNLDDEEARNDNSKSSNPLAPTTRTYNAVLSAWARSDIKEAAPRAEALLYKMLSGVISPSAEADGTSGQVASPQGDSSIMIPPPDRYSFNTVISAHARSFSPGAAERGEELFDMMYELYHTGRMGEDIKPKADTYSSVINAWARSRGREGQTANARRLLDTMIEKFRGGEEDMAPNMFSYTAVLNSAVNEVMKEEKVWADGDDDISDADVDQPFGDDSAYSIAVRTYHEMKSDAHDCGVQPDHITYATMLKVVGGNTAKESSERRSMLETVFEDACAAGRVSSHVLKELRLAAPSVDLLERLLRSRELATSEKSVFQELPKRWTRNVNVDQRRHRVNMKDMVQKEVRASASSPK